MSVNDASYYYFAKNALLEAGWAQNVLFEVCRGHFVSMTSNSTALAGAIHLAGPVLPTMANVHSHAFQRVMAGTAEVSVNPNDSFWGWRDVMYNIVQKLTPKDAQIIATALYIDMLKAGYTQVGEFHYLHHAPQGKAYSQPEEMALRVIEAANVAGIGVTLLPVLYSHSGFGGRQATADQARFTHSTQSYLDLHNACAKALTPELCTSKKSHAQSLHKLGICFHSLRAVTKAQMNTVLHELDRHKVVHIHIAEQQKEVQACLSWSGQRPVEWLHNNVDLNNRWCLVHATHVSKQEVQCMANSQAVVGLCPTTEANLGDGIFPATEFEAANGRWGIGSDSHVSLSLVEELRTLEYGQRLRDQQRNRLHSTSQPSVGDNLFAQARQGGNQACDVSLGLTVGNRADFMVLDEANPFIAASHPKDIMNRWLFACHQNLIKDVFVAGKQVIKNFTHEYDEPSRLAFIQVIKKVMYNE
ncbi:formimidoylglutamate deiminase [Marinagarivorans algicola]|uniref:formimidoylglutamate deiminase n=1 Tax=Marinagarivorans algicola TaxID=1513270 RepID=UPI0037360611